jgi:type IV secretory pathway TrbF-like protein
MKIWDSIKVKLGMAAPHMKPDDVPPWGEFGWVVDQWYRQGRTWRTACLGTAIIGAVGWYLYVDAEVNRQPIPPVIHSTLLDLEGRVIGTHATSQGEEPPNKVREATIKQTFFRMRRIPGSIDAVADNLKDLTAYLGKPAESKTRACLSSHPVEEMVDQGIRREVLNMRYVPGRLNAAAVSLYWTEIERDQLENVRSRRDVEATATVRLGGQCPDADKNPYCLVVEEFSWSIPDC